MKIENIIREVDMDLYDLNAWVSMYEMSGEYKDSSYHYKKGFRDALEKLAMNFSKTEVFKNERYIWDEDDFNISKDGDGEVVVTHTEHLVECCEASNFSLLEMLDSNSKYLWSDCDYDEESSAIYMFFSNRVRLLQTEGSLRQAISNGEIIFRLDIEDNLV